VKKIRIKNVKTLGDTGDVALAPITLLVGKNSSGKSTFLRTFPLIKQSIRKSTDGPLLWAGDVDDYVDFGSFAETVTDGLVQDKSVKFDFNFELNLKRDRYYFGLLKEALKNTDVCEVNYSIAISQVGRKEYVSRLAVNFCNTNFVFDMNPNPRDVNVIVDGICLSVGKKSFSRKIFTPFDDERRSIFGFELPPIDIFLDFMNIPLLADDSASFGVTLENFGFENFFMPFTRREIAMQIVGECLCKGVPMSLFSIDLFDTRAKNDKEIVNYMLKIVEQLNKLDEEQLAKSIVVLKLIYFYGCFSIMDKYIEDYFRQVHYIAPLRATAERYYRLRNVSIDEVDYQGKNLAIFLDGLRRNNQLFDFNQWTDEFLGFHVRPEIDGGHLSIQVGWCGKEKSTNLSDTGFGFSQILPIVTQLWEIVTKKPRANNQRRNSWNIPLVLAIEQPELHLHPALQADLVEAFINSIVLAKKNRYSLQLILETHSETIVNYFGRSIAKNRIDGKDVSVVLFDKDSYALTKVKASGFDRNGYLLDWPIGFFSVRSRNI